MRKNKYLNISGAILTTNELEKHLEKLGTTYNLTSKSSKDTYPIPRLMNNYYVIKDIYTLLNEHVKLDIPIHPAGEWILDNFYIIEECVKIIKQNLTLKKYTNFIGLKNGQYAGFARVYVLASEIVNYTDNKIEIQDLEKYLIAYQTNKTLNMDEIWDIGLFLNLAIIENIRQICERIYISQIEKYKVENIIVKHIDSKNIKTFKNFKINRNLEIYSDMKYPFIEYMSYKLKTYGKKTAKYLDILEEIVEKTGTTVADIVKKEHFDVALRRVSIGNCINSIKRIQRINFLELFEQINGVEEILKSDPAKVYDKMDYKTKDYYRQEVKNIAKNLKISEIYVAKKILELAQNKAGKESHIGYYLIEKNRNLLYKKIGLKPKKIMNEEQKTKYYISMIAIFTMIISLSICICLINKISSIYLIITFLIILIPISEFVIQIIQYILSKVIKPKIIPKLNMYEGIDKENSTMVVIPTILKDKEKVKELMKKLEVFYLANKSKNLYFCLLGDCSESKKEIEDFDQDIIYEGKKQVDLLNKKYKSENDIPIFYYIYRKRKWNEKQKSYLGWERKRGALVEFAEFLLGNMTKEDKEKKYYINTIQEHIDIKYIITLDCDTDLILNSAFELIGSMAHILNKPEIKEGRVVDGYGLIQPRVGVNIDISYKNLFTKIFAGSGGIDSYTNAISDIYQDNFGEGIFTGKGIFDLNVFSKILKNEIPENMVLSHDLLEGCYLRCGLASDIMLMDGYPTKYASLMSRLSRWIRGDWQIIRWLKNKKLNLLSKLKIFDNLRRSILEISVLIAQFYFYILYLIYKINVWGYLIFLGSIVILPFLLEISSMIIFKKQGEHKQELFTPKITGFLGAIDRAILTYGCLPYKAYVSLNSIIKSIYRMYFSKKRLLEWTTSEESEKNANNDILSYYKSMFINIVFGIVDIVLALSMQSPLKLFIGILWIVTPYIMCKISKEITLKKGKSKLNKEQQEYLRDVAFRTYKFFQDNLTEENNYLIPDNYQEDRKQRYVDRTSSTNIGLSLLAVITGIDLKFISESEGINLLNNIIQTIDSLEKWNGHLFNWYNIKTKSPLIPRYISTVDSGNFVGYLYVVKSFLNNKIIEIPDELETKQTQLIENLYKQVSNIIEKTDFSHLYSKQHRLFSIGFNIEEGKLTDSYYDLLASEARQASLVAIAKKDVPSKHWNNLSRTLTILNNKKGLVSWSGTAFEYLMPNINIPRYEGSLLDESCKFAIMSQMMYAKKLGIPWGVSEAAFNVKDLHSNYQYKAFGIPWLGLKRGLEDDMVIATYGSVLAITDKPQAVYKNLKLLEQYGMLNKYGFYESLDLTPERQPKGKVSSVVATYMAHHQALLLLSINNLLNDNILQKRFVDNPEIESVSILLQERMPETFIITKEEKELPKKPKYQDYENFVETIYKKIDENLVRGNLISNENYLIAINQKGQGVSRYKDIDINRYKKTDDYNQGILTYIKNIKSKKIWRIGEENTTVSFTPDKIKMERIDENIKTIMQTIVDIEEPVEIRRIMIENQGNQDETIEITNLFEPVLSNKEQEYAHPAFNNMFLKFNYNNDEKVLEVERKNREKSERKIHMLIKFSTESETIVDNEFEISKSRLDKRGNYGIPESIKNSTPFSNRIGLVTEPVIAMKKTIRIKPKDKVFTNLVISVNEDKNIAYDNLRKYYNSESIRREFEISKAKNDAENRYLEVKGKDIILYQKILSYIFFFNPFKSIQMKTIANQKFKQSELWKYGISGDLPIILIKIRDINDMHMIKSILKMYEFFKTKNILVDIVFLDEEKYSYENYIKLEIESNIADRHLEYMKNKKGGIFIISRNEVDSKDIDLFEFISLLSIDAHKGDLEHVINDIEEEYLSDVKKIDNTTYENSISDSEISENNNILKEIQDLKYCNDYGAFSPNGKEYMFCINKNNKLPTVWSHILANEKFGTVITENMGGYTWYKNSRLYRITSWYNKAFLDIPSEVIYLQDLDNGKTWSMAAGPMPDENNYNVVYGFGYAKYIHTSDEIKQEIDFFVANQEPIKIGILKLNNKSLFKKKVRIVYYLKLVLAEDEIKSNGYIKTELDKNANLIQVKNLYENDFDSYIFVSSSEKIKSYTGDRTFFLGKGGLANPDGMKKYKLNNEGSLGKKNCVAIEIEVELESMSNKEIVFTIGAEDNVIDMKNLAYKYSRVNTCKQEFEAVKRKWQDLLEKIQVYTPIDSINIMLNGWTLYQTMTSRIMGKTGYYQSGGAFGFRDQLQDTLAFKFINPEILKKQIILHSKHQFVEGDVEHWWHEETKRGIRTKFSDDLLWLPYLVEQYIETTGDYEILKIETTFLKGERLSNEENERYDMYDVSEFTEKIYNHCIKAIEKAINLGEHGIPKIGSGDWNDGLSSVGNKGKGESIWLGWFIYLILEKFIPICEIMGENNRANDFKKIAEELKKNLNNYGWDGRWFKRAYMDDGKILGSIENEECRIDSIAQSWSIISNAGDNDKKFISMESLENHLVDKENGIIKLLDPPFENGNLEPGYIKAYLPGVRENGGQYTHEYCSCGQF